MQLLLCARAHIQEDVCVHMYDVCRYVKHTYYIYKYNIHIIINDIIIIIIIVLYTRLEKPFCTHCNITALTETK